MSDRESLSPGEVVRLATEVFNAGGGRGDYLAPDAIDHTVMNGTVPGSPEHVAEWRRLRAAFRQRARDLHVTVEQVIENGDTVGRMCTVRWTENGRALSRPSMDIVRVRDGRIVEHWAVAAPLD